MMTQPLKIMLLGSGGREHAYAWAFSKSPHVEKILCVPGNGGTSMCGPKVKNAPDSLRVDDYEAQVQLAIAENINLLVPGSEKPLVDGVEGYFRRIGVPVFGPSRDAAILEGSKCAAKDFMQRHKIPTADYKTFEDFKAAKSYLERVKNPVVIKASGLAAGKGVLMPCNQEESIAAIQSMMIDLAFGDAGRQVVIEELLVGDEISITFFTDGHVFRNFPAGQDAQRILDGNMGANTGGMGVYAPTPLLSTEQLLEIEQSIIQPTIDGIREEGHLFVGSICIGVIMTVDGPKLLEYNVRFGDPEAQTLLPMLDDRSDLAEIVLACIEHRLGEVHMGFVNKYAVSVVMASEGYPGSYEIGYEIVIEPGLKENLMFHAGTKLNGDAIVTNGGRVLASVCLAESLPNAIKGAYRGAKSVNFKGKYHRNDIGQKALEML